MAEFFPTVDESGAFVSAKVRASQTTTIGAEVTKAVAADQTVKAAAAAAVDAAAGGRFARPTSNSITILGHSFIGSSRPGIYNTQWNTQTILYQTPFGYFDWAEIHSGGRLRLLENAGIGGQNSGQVLARTDDIFTRRETPSMVLVHCVRNDIDQGVPVATITANLAAIYAKVRARGATVLAATETPALDDTTTTLANLTTVNAWIREHAARTEGVELVDLAPAIADPATGKGIDGYLYDRVHLNRPGASRCGAVLARALEGLVHGSRTMVTSNVDPTNIGLNPMMLGTTGTPSGVGGVTGPIATGWVVRWSTAEPGAVVCSKVPRTDGINGEWQQIKVTTPPPGAAAYTRLDYLTNPIPAGFTPGTDGFYVECEYEYDGDPSTLTVFGLRSVLGTSSVNAYALVNFQGETIINPGLVLPSKGVLRSPVVKSVAGMTGIGLELQIGGGAGMTFRFARAAIRKATPDMLPATA